MMQLIVILILIGVGLYLLNTLVPLDVKIKTIINVVIIIAVLLWVLKAFGIFSFGGVHPRVVR
jgi:hypothetical protein